LRHVTAVAVQMQRLVTLALVTKVQTVLLHLVTVVLILLQLLLQSHMHLLVAQEAASCWCC
jgi:hypothetical protein